MRIRSLGHIFQKAFPFWTRFGINASLVTVVMSAALFAPTEGIAKSTGWNVDFSQQRLDVLEESMFKISENYTKRQSVLGKSDADVRFDDALFEYLMGNYKASAEGFYVLLEVGAITDASLVAEAEWYLVDSAFQIEQYALLEEYAYHIIEQPAHMFFTDAVRLLLEAHGRRGRSDKFREDYGRFVLSGLVESSDALNYAIGKSFYFQGDTAQAKQAFFEIQQGSPFWYRTQYFLGGMYVAEENLEKAAASFEMAWNSTAQSKEEIQLNDLSILARARVLYAQKDYLSAINLYNKIPYASVYFFDRLFETAWAFIELGQWQDAIDVIITFLDVYPENENAIRFRNTLGDLYMQIQEYELALDEYNYVIEHMEPVRDRLVDILEHDALVQELLDAKLKGQTEPLRYGIPEYIEDRLYKDPKLNQTADLLSLTREQKDDVQNAQNFISEIDAVLTNEYRHLYAFEKDKHNMDVINQEMLLLLLNALEGELSLIEGSVKDQTPIARMKMEIARARSEFQNEQMTIEQMRRPIDREQDEMIIRLKKVQQEARDVRSMTTMMLDEVEAFVTEHEALVANLPERERKFFAQTIADLQKELNTNYTLLREVITEDTQALMIRHLGEERYYRDVISTVQQDAVKTKAMGEGLLLEANHFLDDYSKALQNYPEAEIQDLQAQLQSIQTLLKESNAELEVIASDTTRNVLLAQKGFGSFEDANLNAYLLRFQQIHNQLLPLWSASTLKNKTATLQEIDQLWLHARKIDAAQELITDNMKLLEGEQRQLLAQLLREQDRHLSGFADEVVTLANDAEALGHQAAVQSFENAIAHVDARMLGAELGGVKVSWIRSTDIEEEILRLRSEEAGRIGLLNKRFGILVSKLSE